MRIIEVPIGIQRNGRLLKHDLTELPHLLISGSTNFGKSAWLRQAIMAMALKHPPEMLQFDLIDLKMMEFPAFRNLPHTRSLSLTRKMAMKVVNGLLADMEQRMVILSESGSVNLAMHNHRANPLPYRVCIVDEFADLQLNDRILPLAQKGRAVGIHLIFATQRPSTKIIDGDIKVNFPARLCFRVATTVDSQVVLDAPGAENPRLQKGEALFLFDRGELEWVQGLWLTPERVNHWISVLTSANAGATNRS